MKNLAYLLLIFIFASCQNKTTKEQQSEDGTTNASAASTVSTSGDWASRYDKIEATDIPDNPIQLIGKDWMLITAGTEKSYNSMTASWGALGEIWSKPVSLITVRDIRYTYQFLETNETYTLTFFTEEYRGALNIMGTKSGRDGDKAKEAGLTPIVTPLGNMAYAEANMILECKKLYAEPMKKESILDKTIVEKAYEKGEKSMHTLYIGEIVNVWVKK